MVNGPQLLKTTALNSFGGPDKWVYVKLGDKYLRKKVSDLHVGDVVVIENEGISKTLEEIEPDLEEIARYRAATASLFERNANGDRITTLRRLLLEGLAQETPDLDERISKQGGVEFSHADYHEFSETVMEVARVARDTTQDWLKGKTIAPKQWDKLERLAAINSAFMPLYESKDQEEGFHADYRLYKGVRSSVMRYINRLGSRESAAAKPKRESPKREGKYAAEISHIVNKFVGEIDDTYGFARVTGIEKVKPTNQRHSRGQHEKPEHELKKGILFEETDRLDLVDINYVAQIGAVLDHTLNEVFERFIGTKYKSKIDTVDIEKIQSDLHPSDGSIPTLETLESISSMITAQMASIAQPESEEEKRAKIAESLGESYLFSRYINVTPGTNKVFNNLIVGIGVATKYSREQIIEVLNEWHTEFDAALQSGEIDRELGFEPHSVSKLIDVVNTYRNALPKALYQYQGAAKAKHLAHGAQNMVGKVYKKKGAKKAKKTQREKEKKADRNLKRIQTDLEKEYGFKPNKKHFLIEYHKRKIGETGDPIQFIMSGLNDDMGVVKGKYEKQGAQFYSREEVVAILDDHGLGSMVEIIAPENFYAAKSESTRASAILAQPYAKPKVDIKALLDKAMNKR